MCWNFSINREKDTIQGEITDEAFNIQKHVETHNYLKISSVVFSVLSIISYVFSLSSIMTTSLLTASIITLLTSLHLSEIIKVQFRILDVIFNQYRDYDITLKNIGNFYYQFDFSFGDA